MACPSVGITGTVIQRLARRRVLFGGLGIALASGPLGPAALADAAAPRLGPKKRLAVAKVAATGKFQQAVGGTDTGDVLADQLSSILAESGVFNVEDRADVAMTLKEQGLTPPSASAGVAGESPTPLIGAQVIVRATISTFDQTAGGGLSIGLGGAGTAGSLGRNSNKGVIAMDVRLIDTTTGKILAATHVQETVSSSNMSLGFQGPSGLNINQTAFEATPLGKATELAFQKLVPWIAEKLRDVAWTGRVADVDGPTVFLNLGAESGVQVGDAFTLTRITRRIVDPSSGELLGVVEAPVGEVIVTAVDDRFSQAKPSGAAAPLRGDVARYIRS
jgi:curli biogenesis system outer membrane secretion channel CsgG